MLFSFTFTVFPSLIPPADSNDIDFTPGMAQSVIWSAGPVGSVNNDVTGSSILVPFQHYEDRRARRGGTIILNILQLML